MKKLKWFAVISLIVLGSASVSALDLEAARNSGKVVELPTGYLQAKDPAAKKLVEDVNKKRKAAYTKIAKKTKTTVEQVGKQAAIKIKMKLEKK